MSIFFVLFMILTFGLVWTYFIESFSKGLGTSSQTYFALSLYIFWQIQNFILHTLEGHEHISTNLHVITKAIEQFINITMHK